MVTFSENKKEISISVVDKKNSSILKVNSEGIQLQIRTYH